MLVCLGSGRGRRIGPVHLVLVAVGVLERAGKSAYLGKGALAGYRGRDLLGSYVLDGSNGVVLRVDDADYLALGVGQGFDIGEAEVALELLSELLDCRRSVFFGAEVERLLDEVDAGLFDDEGQGALAVVVVCLYLRGLNISCGEAARPALAGYGEECGQIVAVLCLGVSALFKSFLRAVEDELLERRNGLFEQGVALAVLCAADNVRDVLRALEFLNSGLLDLDGVYDAVVVVDHCLFANGHLGHRGDCGLLSVGGAGIAGREREEHCGHKHERAYGIDLFLHEG